jgi:hypothetical protein
MKQHARLGLAGLATAAMLLAGAGRAAAQGAPAGPPSPPPGDFRGPGPMGPDDAMGFVRFESRFGGKTVTGSPFTAEFTSQSTETLSDGNTVNRKTTGSLARDGQGRTRSEVTLPAIGQFATGNATGKPPHGIFINDPVARTSYVLEADRKVAREMKMRDNGFRRGPGGPGGPGGPDEGGARPNGRNSADVTTQSLGTQTIGGIAAEGTRTVRTVPAGQIGNAKPIEISVERWYSSELQMNVMIKRSDPRAGTTVYQLTNVVRSEPDASLFQVPSDYTVKQAGEGGRRGMREGRNGPPPPPQQ